MRKLIFVFGILVSLNVSQAQYQDLVDQKITQILQLQAQVSQVNLPERDQALDVLATNLEQLMSHRDEVDLVKLKSLESDMNQINQRLAQAVLQTKKIQLQQKLAALSTVIEQRQAAGQSVAALEKLWNKINKTLQNL